MAARGARLTTLAECTQTRVRRCFFQQFREYFFENVRFVPRALKPFRRQRKNVHARRVIAIS
jgi:hypothetical protein